MMAGFLWWGPFPSSPLGGSFFLSGAFFQTASIEGLAGRWRGYNMRANSSYLIAGVNLLVDIAREFHSERWTVCLVWCCVILSVR